MMLTPRTLAVLACALLSASLPTSAQTRLVNMVPNPRSGETNQDAEPTITVDPRNHARLVGSAFTWDNLTQGPNVTANAPIYVSLDRGNTWNLSFIVPSRLGGGFPTGDITVSFSSTLSGATNHVTSWLYAGILSVANATTLPMVVLRVQDPFDLTAMASIDSRPGNVDQPHTTAKTSGTNDKLYVGFNNGFGCLAPSGRSSTVDVSQDGKAGTPTFTLDVIDARTAPCQDWFAQVVAAHSDGTVYAAFVHDLTGTPRLVVVRDDNWALGPSPFTALQDPSDLLAGRFVTTGITRPSGSIGQNRLGASNVSIAVDPGNSDRVYVAWGDGNGANSETIHVRRSIDRGVTWSADLVTLNDAVNPQVAINSFGVVGLLYQQVTGGKWETRFARTNDMDATTFNMPGLLLVSQSSALPLSSIASGVYVGDYASLVAAGREFFGMFSASNFPDKANFMNGIKYQREVDWVNHKLYADAAHTVLVAASIDPFFFYTTTSICDFWRIFCGICGPRWNCFAIYDPWWWLKCPMCGITIFVNPGDPFTRVTVFDSRGKQVGVLKRRREPAAEKGFKYTYAISLKPTEAVGYVLRAEPVPGKTTAEFQPTYIVKVTSKSPGRSP